MGDLAVGRLDLVEDREKANTSRRASNIDVLGISAMVNYARYVVRLKNMSQIGGGWTRMVFR